VDMVCVIQQRRVSWPNAPRPPERATERGTHGGPMGSCVVGGRRRQGCRRPRAARRPGGRAAPAQVEVGLGLQAVALERRDVVRLGRLLLRGVPAQQVLDPLWPNFSLFIDHFHCI